VTGIEPGGSWRIVRTDEDVTYLARAVILSSGGHARTLGVPGEDRLRGRGVSYCAICDGAFYRNRNSVLAVVGGGDSALQESTYLTRFAERVFILHRRDRWRAQPALQQRALEDPKITPIWDATVQEIGGTEKVKWLRYRTGSTGRETRLDVDGVFIYVGFRPNSELCGPTCVRDDWGFLVANEMMATKLDGVFVAGDVRSKYVRQIANAVGDATTAAVAATRYSEALSSGDADHDG
jgi:thioredoxin reductase (NADPH)